MNPQHDIPAVCAMLLFSMGCCVGETSQESIQRREQLKQLPDNHQGDEPLVLDFADLDEPPALLDKSPFPFPRWRNNPKDSGKYWIYIELNEDGCATVVCVFDGPSQRFRDLIEKELWDRQFTAPTLNGQPVRAYAFLPIPIKIQ
ncbi:hypothetical protein [Cerasicoccus maritimus]|uniref:hypothetical protein n=1 Tax=Cerasicoccus maritimus TaxID=490089 RepID=UPI002852C867|nr:hypothetical protein [Cerasicoccus maritimus]